MERIPKDPRKRNTAVLFLMAVFIVVLGFMTGCSGIRPYPNTKDKNLFVDLKTDRGVRVSLDVYRVGPDCRVDYQGTVRLGNKRSEVGIPSGERLFLSFNFARSSIIFGKSSMGHGTLIKPRDGKIYRAEATYRDSMYNVEIYEAASLDAKGSEVEHLELNQCKP
jgi:hypothetical protein